MCLLLSWLMQDNTSLRQLKLGNNAASTMFGMGMSTVRNIFKQRQTQAGLVTTLS